MLATALCGLAGCGGSKPPAGTGDTPPEGADLRVAEGAHIVVPTGKRVGLGEEQVAPRAWWQQHGPATGLDFLQQGLMNQCREAGGPDGFCALLDPTTPLGDVCRQLGLPPATCDLLGEEAPATPEEASLTAQG